MRRNIGLLIDDLNTPYSQKAIKGAELASLVMDANLYIFPGMNLGNCDFSDDYLRYNYQYNTLFQFANTKKLDILYIMLDCIGMWINRRERKRFLEQFLGIPVVTLFTSLPGYHAVLFDNESSFTKQIEHLIVDHNARKIGYVSGPKGNVDATERLQTFQKVLMEHDLPFDESDIIYGNFNENSESLIDSFLIAHPDYDAIVFANDNMAKAGYKSLAKLGKKVGSDVLVVGFDNASFSSTLNPPLTTIEANAAELTYVAIKHIEDFINQENDAPAKTVRVATHNIHRCSCGCSNYNYDSLAEKLKLKDLFEQSRHDDVISHIMNFLFAGYARTNLQELKELIANYIDSLCSLLQSADISTACMELRSSLSDLIDQSLFFYTSAEQFVNLLASLEFVLTRKVADIHHANSITSVFSIMYQELAKSHIRTSSKQITTMTNLTQIMDSMSADMSRSANSDHISFSTIIKRIHTLGIRSTFLYTYDSPIVHPNGMRYIRPDKMLLRAYEINERAFSVPKQEQLIIVDDIFSTQKREANTRGSYVISPLFSQEELLGLLVCETDAEHFSQIPSLATHISSMLKTLFLLEQQKEINDHLHTNLDQTLKHNLILKEISKTDQLTGLYNRRGFMDTIKTVNENPLNDGRDAIILYADMDGLKAINDKYGHDEGDYALKQISIILKEAFRNTDIVSRFGGDEFVAFALLGLPNQANIIYQRIRDITEQHNQLLKKPYRIDMSIGICEIQCSKELNIEAVLDQADKKLYIEKKAKKKERS